MDEAPAEPSPAQEISFLSPESFSTLDEYSKNPRFIELQEELRGVLFARASGEVTSLRATPDLLAEHDDDPGQAGQQGGFDFSRVSIPKIKLIQYLKNWITECAPYLDKFDHVRHFAIRVPVIASSSPALFYAVLAFSARQMERKARSAKNYDSLELYQESIRLLAPGMQAKDSNMLVTACVLAVMELMSGSPRNWRRHIEGCATLFDLFQVNGFSGGVLQAVFWCYARMEVCGAIISNGAESTVLALRNWAPPLPENITTNNDADMFVRDAFYQSSLQNSDMHANWAVYLCAKACDLLYRHTRATELMEPDEQDSRPFAAQWLSLWDELQFWLQTRPDISLPTIQSDDNGELFPAILFAHFPAISSNQVYHATCLIMLDMRPREVDVAAPQSSAVWHARRVCGISVTNPHEASLINAIQPLYLAGRLLTNANEHMQVGRLFKIIEETTGWGALWRLRDLEVVWGYHPGEVLAAIS